MTGTIVGSKQEDTGFLRNPKFQRSSFFYVREIAGIFVYVYAE